MLLHLLVELLGRRRVARRRRQVEQRPPRCAVDHESLFEQRVKLRARQTHVACLGEHLHEDGRGDFVGLEPHRQHLLEQRHRPRHVGNRQPPAHHHERVIDELVRRDAQPDHLFERVPRRPRLQRLQPAHPSVLLRVHVDHSREDQRVLRPRRVAADEQPEKLFAPSQLVLPAAALEQRGVRARVGRHALLHHLVEILERQVELSKLDARVDERRVRLRRGLRFLLLDEEVDNRSKQFGRGEDRGDEHVVRHVGRHALLLLLDEQPDGELDGARRLQIERAALAQAAVALALEEALRQRCVRLVTHRDPKVGKRAERTATRAELSMTRTNASREH
mmetsp:Transcript_26404/g.57868  ORF Transcript_26404/g.57868 Transcript_26404/m.57868 type:complete len:335 (-) Transcript_26404:610-1614(-)